MSRTGVYAGTFDPPTLGHLDIIARATRLFDRLVVGVATNPAKHPLFTLAERLDLLSAECAGAEVRPFEGLLVDFARAVGAGAVVRGLRSGTDYDYEAQMAGMNGAMAPEVETVFLVARPALQPIASSLVKQIAGSGGDYARFLSPGVARAVAAKLAGGDQA